MSYHRVSLAAGVSVSTPPATQQAVWVNSGALDVAEGSVTAGHGAYVGRDLRTTLPSDLVVFRISPDVAPDGAQLTAAFEWQGSAVLRLDQVCFPPGARAYRHVHPGPGIRVLTEGALEIKSDHDCTMMKTGDAWFEDANSPVQATAANIPTAFIRCMVLPVDYLGQTTLQLLDAKDHKKPRLQTNTRFFDQIIDLSGI